MVNEWVCMVNAWVVNAQVNWWAPAGDWEELLIVVCLGLLSG